MTDYPFTIFSFIGVLLCIPPAYFNWKIPSRPWATLILIGWILVLNLLFFIDSIVWSSEDTSTWWDGHVYCDINSRIKDAFTIGVPGAAIGICRFLADATNPDPSQKDLHHTRLRRNLIDFFLGIILPCIGLALKYICEPSRYRINGVNGCTGTIAFTWPSLLVFILWCPVLCLVAAGYAVLFLRHWWVRRKRMNENWNIGVRNGISRNDFRRLFFTVICVLFVYLPLSLYGLQVFLLNPFGPYPKNTIHGKFWNVILFVERPVAIWSSWVGIALAITSFVLIGFTRNAKKSYEHCVEWLYDHAPKKLQGKLGGWKKTSDLCKERRAGSMSTFHGPRNNISMVEGKPRGRAVKNWFDSDEDLEVDTKSLHSSESTLAGKDDDLEIQRASTHNLSNRNLQNLGRSFSRTGITKAEVSAGMDTQPVWGNEVTITRQVIVETSSR